MQLDDRSGKLVLVESLNAAGRWLREAGVGRGWLIKSRFWQYVGSTGAASIHLLARTASRTWIGCALLERRGRNLC